MKPINSKIKNSTKWIPIFKTNNVVHIGAIESHFIEQKIPFQILDKHDSNYVMFGEKQIFIPQEFEEQATLFVQTIK